VDAKVILWGEKKDTFVALKCAQCPGMCAFYYSCTHTAISDTKCMGYMISPRYMRVDVKYLVYILEP